MGAVTIPKEAAREMTWARLREEDESGRYVIERTIVDLARWETIHELVFSWGGVSYMFTYRNATGEGEDVWWQEAPDEIECVEVQEVPTTKFVPVD